MKIYKLFWVEYHEIEVEANSEEEAEKLAELAEPSITLKTTVHEPIIFVSGRCEEHDIPLDIYELCPKCAHMQGSLDQARDK